MRILHIGKYYPPFSGGIENFMGALLPALSTQDMAVSALVHAHQRRQTRNIEEVGGLRLFRAPTWGKLLFVPLSPRFPAWLDRAVLESKPDLIHAHTPNVSAFWLLWAASCRDIPLVIHWHADVLASEHHQGLALAYRFYRPFEQKLLERASAIIATSAPYLDSSPSLRPWLKKCHIVPLGIEAGLSDRPLDRGQSCYSPGRFKVLCVGRLTYYKGHEFLIRAAASLEGIEIVIVGAGEREARLRKLIDELEVQEKVKLFGQASERELQSLLEDCDCFCLPSIERTEAFGLVLLEAMRAGKPAIVTDVAGSGMSWVVQAGLTGLVVKAGDTDSLQSALSRLKNEPPFRAKLGEAGKQRFDEHFTIPEIARQTIEIYKKVLRG